MSIEPFGKEYIKKTNLFGIDISVGWAEYFEVRRNRVNEVYRRVLFLSDKFEADGIITTRYICYKLKLEFKTAVWYDGVLV